MAITLDSARFQFQPATKIIRDTFGIDGFFAGVDWGNEDASGGAHTIWMREDAAASYFPGIRDRAYRITAAHWGGACMVTSTTRNGYFFVYGKTRVSSSVEIADQHEIPCMGAGTTVTQRAMAPQNGGTSLSRAAYELGWFIPQWFDGTTGPYLSIGVSMQNLNNGQVRLQVQGWYKDLKPGQEAGQLKGWA